MNRIGILIAATLVMGCAARRSALEEGFKSPPAEARPWVFWFIMDGNQSREGITADFEAMKRVGVGGVIMMEVDVGIPKGPVKFMSPQWRDLFKHANAEATRLGLVMTMPASPGWTGSGGPWVKPENSMKKIVWSETKVSGGKRFAGELKQPPVIANFYRDVAVLAFPTPAHPKQLPDFEEKTLARRGHYSSEAGVKSILLPSMTSASVDAVVALDRVVDLSDRFSGGKLEWDVLQGEWTIMRFGQTSTGANTRPAPEPGLGLECDKLDRAALKAHFDDFLGKLLADIGPLAGKSLVSLHIDSWEMGPQNWTEKFREEFRTRRGYDLTKYLPVMSGKIVESTEISERFLWDVRQTVLELITENHAGYLAQLAREKGLGLSIEPYDGTPCDDMTYGSRADVPMCEFWNDTFKTWFSCVEATSIAHTTGKKIVGAEAFTSGEGERWRADPSSLKVLGDWAFCQGVNRFVMHRYAHQPWLDRWPGMTMGIYGIHFERTQTWWEQSRAWTDYLARCQFMLRQGLPVADVLFLAPEASPQVFRAPSNAMRGEPPDRLGYNFDGITAETLLKRTSVDDQGRIVLPDGMTYRVLVISEVRAMTPKLLTKVKELVEAGATVVGPPPLRAPGLSDYPRCDEQVKQIAAEVWGDCDGETITTHRFGKGTVVWRGSAAASVPSLTQARWIWDDAKAAGDAPAGKRYFWRNVKLPADARVESAQLCMTADNSFEVEVNGRRVGSGKDFHVASVLDVAPMLRPGANTVLVAAENGVNSPNNPNPAGLIGTLRIALNGGEVIDCSTDAQWQTCDKPDGENWVAAAELGSVGMGPWSWIQTSQAEVFGDFGVVSDVLGEAGLPVDFESSNPAIRYTHRRTEDAEIYYVASSDGEKRVDADCVFRVSAKLPELWDPVSGQRRLLPKYFGRGGRTTVPLRFEVGQSFFVIFRREAKGSGVGSENFAEARALAELSGAWEVSFDAKWGGPSRVTFEKLEDWTKRAEEGIRHYSGSAVYHKTFDAAPLPAGERVFLDLGKVKNLAEVRLNGRNLGVLWCAPWHVDVTDALRAENNQLEITVVNLWPNRLIGDQALPENERFTRTTWNPFGKDDALLESGLLGPVMLSTSR